MIPEEILRKIHLIHIRTKHLVNDIMAGEYESAFRGRGMEFEEVREYQPGDDVRTIDWNVTARMGKPYIKLFREERELIVMLLVDMSASGQFGTVKKLKKEVAAEVAALLAYTAIRNNDKVGLILFSDHVEKYVPPKKARGHGWRVIREILSFEPQGRQTDIAQALDYLGRVVRKATGTPVCAMPQGPGFMPSSRLWPRPAAAWTCCWSNRRTRSAARSRAPASRPGRWAPAAPDCRLKSIAV